MDYELMCDEGIVEEARLTALRQSGRRLVTALGSAHPLRISAKRVDGWIVGRVELILPGRRISATARREEAILAIEAAFAALRDVIEHS